MNRLQIRKIANDLAYDNINTAPAALDAAVAARAQALGLTNAQYGWFKADVATFLKQYQQANNQDAQEAKMAAVAKTTILVPRPAPAPAPELKAEAVPQAVPAKAE